MGDSQAKLNIVIDAQDNTKGVFTQIGSNLDGIKSKTAGAREAMQTIGTAATVAFGALSVGVVKSASDFSSFDTSIQKAGANVSASTETLQQFRDVALSVSEATGVSADDAANALFYLAGGTISAKDAMDSLQQTVTFAKANQLDLTQATILSSQVMTLFKEKGSDLQTVLDQITRSGQISFSTTTQLADAFSEAAPIAAQLGINITDLTSIIGAMGDAGIFGSEAGVALKRALTELVTPTQQTSDGLAALGLSVDQVQRLLPTPIELLRTLQEHMESIQDPVARASALSQVFGQISGPAMSALLNEGVDAIDGYKTALQSAGGATDDAAQRLTNAANPLQLLQNELHDMSIQIGQALQPALRAVAADLKPVIDAISAFVQAHPKLTAAILLITLGFAGLLAVLLPIALALPGLVLLFSGIGTMFAFVASGPGIAIVAAIAAIGVTIYSIMGIVDIFKNDWTDTWLGIQLIVADTVNNVIGMTETMVNFIIDGVNLAIKAINTVIAQIQKIPGIGSHVSKIGTLSDVSFDRIDTEAIVSSTINKPAAQCSTNITITGNTLLSSDVATQIGDMIMGKLKLSNAV